MRKRISGLMDCKLLLGENFENKEPKCIYILLNTFKVEAILLVYFSLPSTSYFRILCIWRYSLIYLLSKVLHEVNQYEF